MFPSSHPDAKNWIRKDAIPCWGCNLNDSNTVGTRPGSGGR